VFVDSLWWKACELNFNGVLNGEKKLIFLRIVRLELREFHVSRVKLLCGSCGERTVKKEGGGDDVVERVHVMRFLL
jgi:hypothetical protein